MANANHAFNLGQIAYAEGYDIEDNPFSDATQYEYYSSWRNGFRNPTK